MPAVPMSAGEFARALIELGRKVGATLSGHPLPVVGSVIAHMMLQDAQLMDFVMGVINRPDAKEIYAPLRSRHRAPRRVE